MTLPDFFIIGTKKGGTTSVFHYLNEHPEIFLSPVKEPSYFAYLDGRPDCNYPSGLPYPVVVVQKKSEAQYLIDKNIDVATFTTLEAYQSLFDGVKNEKSLGEASVQYMYHTEAPRNIFRLIPEAKIIAVLRNPVERAYSDFLAARRMQREPIEDFIQALHAEDWRMKENYDSFWHYKSFGFYYTQLKRYYDCFPANQIKIILNEELVDQPLETIKGLYKFLCVDDSFVPNFGVHHNIGGIPKGKVQKRIYNWATKPSYIKNFLLKFIPKSMTNNIWKSILSKPSLSNKVISETIAIYEDDVLKLQKLIGRDLSDWLL